MTEREIKQPLSSSSPTDYGTFLFPLVWNRDPTSPLWKGLCLLLVAMGWVFLWHAEDVLSTVIVLEDRYDEKHNIHGAKGMSTIAALSLMQATLGLSETTTVTILVGTVALYLVPLLLADVLLRPHCDNEKESCTRTWPWPTS